MVAAGTTWARWAPLRVSRTRVLVAASTVLTNPVPAFTGAPARGSSAPAADRPDTPGSDRVIPPPSTSASAIMIGSFRFMSLLLCVGTLHLAHYYDERRDAVPGRWQSSARMR